MMEMEGVWPLEETTLEVPAELGIADNKIVVHTGFRGNGHVLIECPMELKMGKLDLEGMMRREIEARHRTMRVAVHLIQNTPKFKDAKLAICAYELDGPQTTRLAGPAPAWAGDLHGVDIAFADKNRSRGPAAAGKLRRSGERAVVSERSGAAGDEARRNLLRDPVNAALAGAAFAKTVLPKLGSGDLPPAGETEYGIPDNPPHGLEVKSQDSPQRGRFYERLTVAPVNVPVFRETDFLVVGGGTCGATCANSAGREGARTVLLELCPAWAERERWAASAPTGMAAIGPDIAIRNAKLVDEVHKSIHWPTSANTNERPVEHRSQDVRPAAGCRAVRRGDFLHMPSRWRPCFRTTRCAEWWRPRPTARWRVLSKITADTTGDGDVAAFAGAKFFYGAARDGYPMWFNLAQYLQPTKSRWHFGHTVVVSNIDDYTRAILIGRRRGPVCHDHGNYIARARRVTSWATWC